MNNPALVLVIFVQIFRLFFLIFLKILSEQQKFQKNLILKLNNIIKIKIKIQKTRHKIKSQKSQTSQKKKKHKQKTLSEVGIDPPQCMTNWCCNNFIVHKSRVLQHPLSHYHHLLDFVIQERKGEAGWKHGCFYLEHAWHLLFGEPADMYLLRSSTQLNGDCMIGGNEYDDNPERPNPFNREPYLWLKH